MTNVGPPPIDPASLERAAYAVLPAEWAERKVRSFPGTSLADPPPSSGWFSFAPGIHPLSLGLAVVSDEFAEWLTATVDPPEDKRIIRALREMPEEEAFGVIRAHDRRRLGDDG